MPAAQPPAAAPAVFRIVLCFAQETWPAGERVKNEVVNRPEANDFPTSVKPQGRGTLTDEDYLSQTLSERGGQCFRPARRGGRPGRTVTAAHRSDCRYWRRLAGKGCRRLELRSLRAVRW